MPPIAESMRRMAAVILGALLCVAVAVAASGDSDAPLLEDKVDQLEEQFLRQELLALRRVEGVETRMETLDRNLNRIFLIFGLSAALILAFVIGHQRVRNRLDAERIDRAVHETETLNADIRRELSRPEMEFLRIGHFLRRLMRQFSEQGASPADIIQIRVIGRDPHIPVSLHYIAQVLIAEYEKRWHDAEASLEQLRQLDPKDPFVLLHLSQVHTHIAEQVGDVRDRKRHLQTANQYYAQFAIVAQIDKIPERPQPVAQSAPQKSAAESESADALEIPVIPPAQLAAIAPPKETPVAEKSSPPAASPSATAIQTPTFAPPPQSQITKPQTPPTAPPQSEIVKPQTATTQTAPHKTSRTSEIPPAAPQKSATQSESADALKIPVIPPAQPAAIAPPKETPVAEKSSPPSTPPSATAIQTPTFAPPPTGHKPPPVASSPPVKSTATPQPQITAPESIAPPLSEIVKPQTAATQIPPPPTGYKPPPVASPPPVKSAATPQPQITAPENIVPKDITPPLSEIVKPQTAATQIPPPTTGYKSPPVASSPPVKSAATPQSKITAPENVAPENTTPPPVNGTAALPASSHQTDSRSNTIPYTPWRNIGGAIKRGSANLINDVRNVAGKIGSISDGHRPPFLPVPATSELPEKASAAEMEMWKCIRRGDLRMAQAANALGIRRRNNLIDHALTCYAQAQGHKTNETLYLNWGLSLLGKALHLPEKKRELFFNAAIDKFLAGNVIAPHHFDFSLATLYAIVGRETECKQWLAKSRDSGMLDIESLRHAPDFDGVRSQPWFAEFIGG